MTAPHEFVGVTYGVPDRPCEQCGRPDRDPVHKVTATPIPAPGRLRSAALAAKELIEKHWDQVAADYVVYTDGNWSDDYRQVLAVYHELRVALDERCAPPPAAPGPLDWSSPAGAALKRAIERCDALDAGCPGVHEETERIRRYIDEAVAIAAPSAAPLPPAAREQVRDALDVARETALYALPGRSLPEGEVANRQAQLRAALALLEKTP